MLVVRAGGGVAGLSSPQESSSLAEVSTCSGLRETGGHLQHGALCVCQVYVQERKKENRFVHMHMCSPLGTSLYHIIQAGSIGLLYADSTVWEKPIIHTSIRNTQPTPSSQ